jgi:hypothetical protein
MATNMWHFEISGANMWFMPRDAHMNLCVLHGLQLQQYAVQAGFGGQGHLWVRVCVGG